VRIRATGVFTVCVINECSVLRLAALVLIVDAQRPTLLVSAILGISGSGRLTADHPAPGSAVIPIGFASFVALSTLVVTIAKDNRRVNA